MNEFEVLLHIVTAIAGIFEYLQWVQQCVEALCRLFCVAEVGAVVFSRTQVGNQASGRGNNLTVATHATKGRVRLQSVVALADVTLSLRIR